MEISSFLNSKKKKYKLQDDDFFDIMNDKIELPNDCKDIGLKETTEDIETSFKISPLELLNFKNILEKSFELFEFRNENYDVKNFLKAFREGKMDDPNKFYETIINSLQNNPLGFEYVKIISNYKNVLKITEDKDIFNFALSYLIQNPSKNYTGVIFVPSIKGFNQISIIISKLIISAIFKLYIIDKIPLNEIVIIHSKNFYPEGLKLFSKLNKNFSIQFFSNIEILSPVINNIYVPKIIILSKEEEEMFFKENYYMNKDKMKKIDLNKDPLLKYYGVKKNSLIKIERVELFNDSSAVDMCFSYVF